MAEILLTPVINKSALILGDLLVQGGTRLYWLKEDIDWLQREMRYIRSYIDDAKDKAIGGDSGVKNLLKDIQELAGDVEDLLDDFLPKIQQSNKCINAICYVKAACIPCGSFASEIEKIKRRVADIDRVRKTYDITDTSNNNCIPLEQRISFLKADETVVIGLDDDFNKLRAKLLDHDLPYGVVSIVGMPGLGKTTLAKKLYRHVCGQFECSGLVYVSQQRSAGEILHDIAKQVGVTKQKRKDDLEGNLRSLLKTKSGNRAEAEDLAEDILNDLVSRNLIQVAKRTYDGRISSCRIHDLLHSLCVELAKESNFFHTEHNAFSDPDNIARMRRITFYSDDNSMNKLFRLNGKPKKLRALFCFTKHPCIFSQMAHLDFKFLQVLVVDVPKGHLEIVKIPNKIENMSCLRYLRLEGLIGGKLPNSIVKHIETVDTEKSDIRFPSGVWESKQLRHLLYNGDFQISDGCFSINPKMYSLPPNNLQTFMWMNDQFFEPRLWQGLSKLRKLGIKEVSDSTINILSASSPMSEALEVLKLHFSREPSEQLNLSSYPNIAKLHVNTYRGMRLNIEAFPPYLVKLTLFGFRVDHHLLAMLKRLPKLRILKMVLCRYNERQMDLSCEANGDSFPQLEVLHIQDPSGLSEATCWDDVSMPKLKKILLVHSPIRLPERLAKLAIFENLKDYYL